MTPVPQSWEVRTVMPALALSQATTLGTIHGEAAKTGNSTVGKAPVMGTNHGPSPCPVGIEKTQPYIRPWNGAAPLHNELCQQTLTLCFS